ncbi:MAG: hypothetical protein ABFS02_14545 [Pseudomonadota bacterium]
MKHELQAPSESNLSVTSHAGARMQQRGIDKLDVFLLREFGRKQHKEGAVVRFFDRKRAEKVAGRLIDLAHDIQRLRNLFLVESNDALITVAHRHRHHKR